METPSPIPLGYAPPPSSRPLRPMALLGIAGAAVVAGAVVGASTNAVNGAVSPTYFINVMGWQSVPSVWLASIVQGICEGAVVGVFFSLILTTTIAIITRVTCPLGIGMRWLGYIMLAIYATWIIGGICGVGLAEFNPTFFRDTFFFKLPSDHWQMLRFAWVGGSIWGAEPGGLMVIIIALPLIRISWRRMLKHDGGRSSYWFL